MSTLTETRRRKSSSNSPNSNNNNSNSTNTNSTNNSNSCSEPSSSSFKNNPQTPCPKKARFYGKKKIHLDILRFMNSKSLQSARLASKQLNELIEENLKEIARTPLEIVQIRFVKEREFVCRCLPTHGPAHQYKAESMLDAVAWLRPLIRNCFIRLFNLQNLELDNEALEALEKVPECRLVQLSLVGISMTNTNAEKLTELLQIQLRANRYYFGRVRNVTSNQFHDGMLKSEAFLAMEKIQIDIASYLDHREYLSFSDDAIIEWFFAAKAICGYAVMIVRDVELRDDFLTRLFAAFKKQTKAKSISMVLCGQCKQNSESFKEIVTLRNEVETCAVVNEETGEELEVEVMDKNRLEIARRTLKKEAQLKFSQKYQLGSYRKLSSPADKDFHFSGIH